jgi:transcriptional regulator with XRE-family HTH domain
MGLSIRALRRRRGWTQAQVAARCGVSAAEISRLERGAAGHASVRRLDSVFAALGARLSVRVLWQGEELNRLLDRDHARLVEFVMTCLARLDWIAVPEVTFQVYGERGSIDVLAWHETTATVLVIEVKTVVPDVQALLAGLDRKARLAPGIARDRRWHARTTAKILVLPADRTSRRRVDVFSATFERALPARTVAIKRWLAGPSGSQSGIWFVSDVRPAQPRHRVPAVRQGLRTGPDEPSVTIDHPMGG